MAEKEYIERGAIVKFIQEGLNNSDKSKAFGHDAIEILAEVFVMPVADVVEVVRCKDCIWFVPEFVLTNDGERRPYTEEEKNLPFGVLANVGINCGSRCERCSEWEENRVPVFVQENDFCSYGERKSDK